MDIDNGLVRKILDGGSAVLFRAQEQGIDEKHLVDTGRRAYRFVLEYFREYGEIPDEKIVRQKTGVEVDRATEPAEFYIDEIKDRVRFRLMKRGVRGVLDSLEAHKVQDASDKIIALGRDIWRDVPGATDVQTVFSLAKQVKEHYLKIKRGEIGIPTPWGGMTDVTLGWWPGDLVAFISRMGQGKCVVISKTYMTDSVTGERLTAKEVIEKQKDVFTFNREGEGDIYSITPNDWIKTGTKRCLTLKTRLGRQITVTPEHPMLTSRGWVQAAELDCEKDWVVGAAWEPEPKQPVEIPQSHVEMIAKSVKKKVPLAIWRLPNQLLARFIEVFWACDGSVGCGRGDEIEIILGSEGLIDDLQHLLLRFGVVGAKSYKKATCNGKEFDAWRLRIEGWTRHRFRDAFCNIPGEKGERLKRIEDPINPNTDVVPSSDELKKAIIEVREQFKKKWWSIDRSKCLFRRVSDRLGINSYLSVRNFVDSNGHGCGSRRYLRILFDVAEGQLDRFRWMVSEKIVFDKLIGIEDAGVCEVGDFTVHRTANFIANDFVAHNSFTMILLARAAWEAGYRVLFVCTEMSRVKIAQRFFSIHLGVKYDDLRRAQLGEFEEQEFFEKLEGLQDEQGIDLVGDDFDVTLDSIEAAVYQMKPQLLIVDGMYLVKVKGMHDRHTRVSHVADELKKMGKRYGMATVISSQFNRSTKKDDPDTALAENIGISDVLSWDSDVVWALVQTTDMHQDREMTFKALKVREGELTDVVVKWDFEDMNFSEIVEGGGGKKEYDDAEFEDAVPF